MLVLVQVSSMNTSRETSTRFWRLRQRALWRVMSARSRSRAMSVFFLCVTPRRRKKRLIIEVSALTPRSTSNRWQSALSVDVRIYRLSALREILDAARVSDGGIRPFCSPRANRSRSKRCTHI